MRQDAENDFFGTTHVIVNFRFALNADFLPALVAVQYLTFPTCEAPPTNSNRGRPARMQVKHRLTQSFSQIIVCPSPPLSLITMSFF